MSITFNGPPTPTDVVLAIYDAFARGDLPTILCLVDPAAEIRQTDALPWGGVHRGHDGLRAFLAALTEPVQSRFVPERIVPAGAEVVCVGRSRGVVRATGRAFDVAAVHVWSVAHGRARRLDAYIDTPAMLEVMRREWNGGSDHSGVVGREWSGEWE